MTDIYVGSYQYEVDCGVPPYTFSIIAGALPTGLSMDSDGLVTGLPTVEGTFTWTVQVEDSEGNIATLEDSSTITNDLRLSGDLPDGYVDDVVSYQYTALGGTPPYTFSILSGTLPDGLSMSSAGLVTGTRGDRGEYSWVVQVVDDVTAEDTLADDSETIATSSPLVLIINSSEWSGYPYDLEATSGLAPTISRASATSADGIVLATKEADGLLHIYRWSGTEYEDQTIVDDDDDTAALTHANVTVSADGVWVLASSYLDDRIYMYKYDGTDYAFMLEYTFSSSPHGMCFSPDGSQLAVASRYRISRFNFNTTTGALTSRADATSLTQYRRVDWVGDFLLVSDEARPTVYRASTMAKIATANAALTSNSVAYWSADAGTIYWRHRKRIYAQPFTGSAFGTRVELNLGSERAFTNDKLIITKDRDYLLAFNTNNEHSIIHVDGTTMTLETPVTAAAPYTGVWTGLL